MSKRPIVNVLLSAALSVSLAIGLQPSQANAASSLYLGLGPGDWYVGEGPEYWVWEGAGEKVITVSTLPPSAGFVGTVDYEAVTNGAVVTGTLTITPEHYRHDIRIPVVDDDIAEPSTDRGYVKLFNYSSNLIPPDEDKWREAPIFILDDEDPILELHYDTPSTIEEGQTGGIALVRRGNLFVPLQAELTHASQDAVYGEDFVYEEGSQTIQLPAVQIEEGYYLSDESYYSTYVGITALDDAAFEPDESFEVTVHSLSNGAAIHSVSKSFTIADNDVPPPPPSIAYGQSAYAVQEGTAFAEIELVRTGDLTASAYVQLCACSGSAKPGKDYEKVSAWFAFAPGQDRMIVPVAIRDDSKREGEEVFHVAVTAVSGAVWQGADTASVAIADND